MNDVSSPPYFAIIIVAALAILATRPFILVPKNTKWAKFVFAIRHWLANRKGLEVNKEARSVQCTIRHHWTHQKTHFCF